MFIELNLFNKVNNSKIIMNINNIVAISPAENDNGCYVQGTDGGAPFKVKENYNIILTKIEMLTNIIQ